MPANELSPADAGHQGLGGAEGSDFAKSFDRAEPAVGNAADLPETGNFGGAASDWLVEEPPVEDAGDLELPGDEPAGEGMFGESSEDDTVDLGSEFEEAQAEMADAGDDYALEQEPVAAATGAEAAAPADEKPAKAKKAKRKPSMVTNIIMYLLGLLIALPFAYAALFFGVKMDPINLAGFLPSWIVPAELKTKTTPINVARVTPPNPTPDQPGAGVPDAGVMGDDSTNDATAEDTGPQDKAADDQAGGAEMPADDDNAAAGENAAGESADP